MEHERRQWLETIAAACERVLADLNPDPHNAALAEDVEELLARTRSELAEEAG
jgi:truncated hemoglobin YjbI